MADGLKLVFKEDIIPARADGLLFSLGPVLVVVPAASLGFWEGELGFGFYGINVYLVNTRR
jgi:hypothetical protein